MPSSLQRAWKRLTGLTGEAGPKVAAAWDLSALVMLLLGAWLLYAIAIPQLIVDRLTTDSGELLVTDDGRPLTTEPDPKIAVDRQRYFRWANPAIVLITLGTLIQARNPIYTLLAKSD